MQFFLNRKMRLLKLFNSFIKNQSYRLISLMQILMDLLKLISFNIETDSYRATSKIFMKISDNILQQIFERYHF